MSYKWTLEDVDGATWPQLMALKAEIERRPPNDVVIGWQEQEVRADATPDAAGLPAKKGKVKRRKHGD